MSNSTIKPGDLPGLIPLPSLAAVDDPPPLEPERPLPMDCCDSGCESCVQDLYADEMHHYRRLLAAWKERNPERSTD